MIILQGFVYLKPPFTFVQGGRTNPSPSQTNILQGFAYPKPPDAFVQGGKVYLRATNMNIIQGDAYLKPPKNVILVIDLFQINDSLCKVLINEQSAEP